LTVGRRKKKRLVRAAKDECTNARKGTANNLCSASGDVTRGSYTFPMQLSLADSPKVDTFLEAAESVNGIAVEV
jgi:hypothetical protein